MPKQIIRDVFEELVETGKKTGRQVADIPGGVVQDVRQQTGLTPKTEEKKQEEVKIKRLEEEDKKKKGKEIAFFKRQVAEFQKLPPQEPSVQQEQEKMTTFGEEKKESPPLQEPVPAKRKGFPSFEKARKVEVKGGIGG